MKTFSAELSMLNKLLGHQCIHVAMGPSMLVRSDGFASTMAQLHGEGWSEWSGFDYAKLDEGDDQDGTFILAYGLKSQSREVKELEVQAIANAQTPWPSLSGLFSSADEMETHVASLTGMTFSKSAGRAGL